MVHRKSSSVLNNQKKIIDTPSVGAHQLAALLYNGGRPGGTNYVPIQSIGL